ncbi:hypothetical protein [Falsiroseomonas sp.]|uniref:hypothetical protein n=1 Tax=Falsiroseomonas sp. TaxID=2870721 RepID=UPI0034A1655D
MLARLRRTDELFRLAASEFDLLRLAPGGLTQVARALRGSATVPAAERHAFFARALAAEPTNAEALSRLVEAKLATEDLAGARLSIAAAGKWADPAILAQIRALLLVTEGDLGAALREAALAQSLAGADVNTAGPALALVGQISTALAYAVRTDMAQRHGAAALDKLRLLRGFGRYGREQLVIELQLLAAERQGEALRELLQAKRELALQNPETLRRAVLLGRNFLMAAERVALLQAGHANFPADVPLLEALLRSMIEDGDRAGARNLLDRLGAKGLPEAARMALRDIVTPQTVVIADDPATEAGQIAIFRRRVAAGEVDAAESDLAAFITRQPDAAVVRRDLIVHFMQLRRNVEAARLIETAPIERETARTLISWAITLFRGHHYESGAELLARIEALEGETPELAMARISATELLGDLEGALRVARARHAKEGSARLLRLMADQSSRLNRFDEARRLLDAYDAVEPGDRTAQEFRRRNEIMEGQHTAWLAEAQPALDHVGDGEGEDMLLGDYLAQFSMFEAAEAAYGRVVRSRRRERRAQPFAVRPMARARRIGLLVEASRFDEALAQIKSLDLKKVETPALLFMERAIMRRTLDPRMAAASARLLAEFRSRANPSPIRRIAIVGGSNTIMAIGWGRTLEALAERALGITVHNYGIGASSSLYGWLRIGKDNLFDRYDLVLFEHALNDAVYVQNGSMDHDFRREVLRAIARDCAARNGRFAMLLTAPRDNADAAIDGSDPLIAETRRFCDEAGIDADDPSERLRELHLTPRASRFAYRDDLHYAEVASTDMAVNLLARIATEPDFGLLRHLPPEWGSHPGALRSIAIAGPDRWEVTGPHQVRHLESSLYSGEFLRLERGARLRLRVSGRLVGLLVNVSADTGYIRVRIGERLVVKNLFGFRNTNDPAKLRILLRQFGAELHLAPDTLVEIDLDLDPADLQRLPLDQTAYTSAPQVPLSAQVLEIGGIILC